MYGVDVFVFLLKGFLGLLEVIRVFFERVFYFVDFDIILEDKDKVF